MEFSLKYSTIYDYSYFFIAENIIKVLPNTHLLHKMLVIYVVLCGNMLCCIFVHLSGNSKFWRAIESKLKKMFMLPRHNEQRGSRPQENFVSMV